MQKDLGALSEIGKFAYAELCYATWFLRTFLWMHVLLPILFVLLCDGFAFGWVLYFLCWLGRSVREIWVLIVCSLCTFLFLCAAANVSDSQHIVRYALMIFMLRQMEYNYFDLLKCESSQATTTTATAAAASFKWVITFKLVFSVHISKIAVFGSTGPNTQARKKWPMTLEKTQQSRPVTWEFFTR